jgi:Tfp pilus assembly ATPase PilU
MNDKLIDFETKKSVHFSLLRETHSHFRIACFKHSLSMQEVLEELVQRIAADNPDMIEILEEIQRKKRDKVIGKLSSTDAESIFNVIESDNPLSSE